MEPIITISYEAVARRQEVRVEGGIARPAEAARELGLAVVRNAEGTSWRVRLCPQRSVRLSCATATLPLDLAGADALFLSGYNCWTDSVERPVDGCMPGLARVPRKVVDKWVLDGSGDYRFVPEDPRPGHQHGFGYGYLRFGGKVQLFGGLAEQTGLTLIREDLKAGTVTLSKEVPQRELEAGETCEALSFALVEGSLHDAFAAWLGLSGITRRPAPKLVGYSSWYRHYTDISEVKLVHDLAGLDAVLGGLNTGTATKVFQVDDGYTKVGDWQTPDPAKFPRGLAPVAAAARDRGYLPGLWMAPFVCERESRLFSEHPDWLLHGQGGELVTTGSQWSGQVALDTQVPEVRAYVTACLRNATQNWGFGFLKLDFLYGACMLPHAGLNRGELMADALGLIREAVGEDVLVDLCGVPMTLAFGRGEYSRVGCDVGLDWDDKPWMRLLHRERVSTKNSLANTRGRAHLNGVALGADPDVFFLRRDVRLTDAQRTALLEADVAHGSILFTSDDMGAWDADQLATYRSAVARFVDARAR